MNNDKAIRALSALAQEHRLAIFRLLVKQGSGGLAAGEICGRIGISATGASFHLKELDRAGLIAARREGRFIRYAFKYGRSHHPIHGRRRREHGARHPHVVAQRSRR
jgi:DNA-binding transcriptional ArsR family regulator